MTLSLPSHELDNRKPYDKPMSACCYRPVVAFRFYFECLVPPESKIWGKDKTLPFTVWGPQPQKVTTYFLHCSRAPQTTIMTGFPGLHAHQGRPGVEGFAVPLSVLSEDKARAQLTASHRSTGRVSQLHTEFTRGRLDLTPSLLPPSSRSRASVALGLFAFTPVSAARTLLVLFQHSSFHIPQCSTSQ